MKQFIWLVSTIMFCSCVSNNEQNSQLKMQYPDVIKLGTIYQLHNDTRTSGSISGNFLLGTGSIHGSISEKDYYVGLYKNNNDELQHFKIPVKYVTLVDDDSLIIEIVDIHEYVNMWNVAPAFQNYKQEILNDMIRNSVSGGCGAMNSHHTTRSSYGNRLKIRIHVPFNRIEQYINIQF